MRGRGPRIALYACEGRRGQIQTEKKYDQDSEAGAKGKDARWQEAREENHADGYWPALTSLRIECQACRLGCC